jgi:hypothetical protein
VPELLLRARLVLNLASLLQDGLDGFGADGVLRRELTVDLFQPPKREALRGRVVALRAAALTEREVAAQLGITVTAAQRAAALQRLLDREGQTDAYVLITVPPDDAGRVRRHRHARYRFEPLDGYPDLSLNQRGIA